MDSVLIVGGGLYQVPLIRRLVEMGYHALCIDKNPNSPGFAKASEYAVIDVLDKKSCLEYAKKNNVKAVMTLGATLPLPTVSYIGEQMRLPVLPYETAQVSRNKYAIKEKLQEAECNITGAFFRANSIEEALTHTFEYPCVVKPCDGSGSKGVSIVHNEAELPKALKYASDAARYGEFYCERFIEGKEYSVEAFVDKGRIYVYGIIKTTFERNGFDNEGIEYGHRTPSGLSEDIEKSITEEIKKAIRALNVTMGSVNFDVIISDADSKPYIIDCGIRIGQNLIASHIIPLSRGVNILDNTIKQALGISFSAEPRKKECIASRLLIYNPGIIRDIRPMRDVIGNNGIVDVVLRKRIGETQRAYVDKSDTCGWVLCSGITPDEAENHAIIARHHLKHYFVIE